ncbi:hypothetical protein BSA16_33555 [Micromonospora sp. Rc5]|nr:hypothetical protein [Micromonospora sp. DH15]OON27135.1 hypothetical protein BSA16_33555 [Micromonospora sp. Rc5]
MTSCGHSLMQPSRQAVVDFAGRAGELGQAWEAAGMKDARLDGEAFRRTGAPVCGVELGVENVARYAGSFCGLS